MAIRNYKDKDKDKDNINKNNNSIFLVNNPYGFRINVNHELIRPLYIRYKAWKGLTVKFPINNQERFEFEDYIIHSKEFKLIMKQTGETIPG